MCKLIFVRHGKALPAGEGDKDIDRPLGEVGHSQAKSRRKALITTAIDYVISSPARRARETAKIVTGKSKIATVTALYPDPHDGGTGTRLDVLFNKPDLGYCAVGKYLVAEDGECVTEWATQAWAHTKAMIDSYGNPDVIAIFGHAVCLPALGMQVCTDGDLLNFRSMIADMNLGECEGFALTVEDGKVVDLETFCG